MHSDAKATSNNHTNLEYTRENEGSNVFQRGKRKEFKVQAEVGVDLATGKPTFNGFTRQRIVDWRYFNLNHY